MKKLFVMIIMMLALISSAFAVSIDDVNLDVDDAVERSNPQFEGDNEELDDSTELEYVTFTFTVQADNGDINVTDVVPDLSGFNYEPLTDENDNNDKFEVSTSLPVSIADGSSKSIQIKILVPSDLDSIDTSFNRISHSVDVDFEVENTTTITTASATGSFYVENGLELSNVEIESPGQTAECDVEEQDIEELDCDDEIEEFSSSEDFTLRFEVENIFDEDSELDIDDVEIEVDVDNSDIDPDDDNFDEDIDAEDELTFTVDFEVDRDVEDGDDVEITLTAIGEDENGATHGFKHTFTIEFEVPDYDVRINSVDLSPRQVCQGETATVSWDIENFGSKEQDNIRIQVVNDRLNVDESTSRIVLEEEDERDNDNQGSIIVTTRTSTDAGAYPLSFRMYYEDDDSNDAVKIETLTLQVIDCEGDDSPEEPETNDDEEQDQDDSPIVVVNPAPTDNTGTNSQQSGQQNSGNAGPVQAVVAQKSNNVWFIVGGIIVLLVLIALIVLVISILLK